MKTTKTFESWYSMIMENELATTSNVDVAEAPTMSNDVDTIMTSLETLAKELTEELSGEEFNELNEDSVGAPGKVMQWIWWMPKARKAQAKINKIKLNIVDMESAAADAPDAQQRARINAKAKLAKDQVPELQKMLHDKFSDKGTLVQKAISSEKLVGQIASIKRATGLEDDPAVKATYKDKMIELQAKYKEDEAAIRELEPSDEDKKAEKERLDREAEDDRERQKTLDADAKKSREDLAKANGKSEKSAEEIEQEKQADLDAKAKAQNTTDPNTTVDPNETEEEKAAKSQKIKITNKTSEIKKLKKSLAAENAKETKDDAKISEIEGKIQTANQELATLKKSSATESLVTRANAAGLNELATEIESKFDWQVSEGTALHLKYNELIKKAEYSNTLNESKYENLSIKERFSRLM